MYSKKINQLATNLNPQPTDLLPIGDAETGQLKTTTFGSVSGITGDGVISGGIVTWTGTGLIFNISACTYILNGIRYSSPFSTKTLAAADPTNPRIDVFAVNTSSQVEVIQGTPASNPIEPEGDTATTLGLTNVTINAGATTPNNVNRTIVYDENFSSPTEWSKSVTQSASSFNYADTAFPYTGTKAILATMGAGFINFNFNNATTLDISNFKSLSFAIRLNSALTSNTILSVRFLNGSNIVTNLFQINSTNNVGFNRNLAGVYQLITIPFNNTNLKFTSNTFDTIRIGTQNAAATYRLDTIQLNGGINNPSGGGTTPSNSFGFVNGTTGTASSTTATDTLNVVGTGLATTSATGKTLTIAVPTPIPSQTGNSGKFLTTNGTAVSWGAAQAQLNGTGFVKASGTTISYDNSTYITGNQSITLSGDISGTGTTAITTAIGANKVTNAMLAQVSTATFKGRVTASTGNVEDLTGTQATILLDTFTSSLKGLAPASGGGTTNFLRADGTWAAAGGGTNFYTTDGTLTSNRTLTHGGFNLSFVGSSFTNRFTSAGRLLIGTTTESTFILDVNGDARVGVMTVTRINTDGLANANNFSGAFKVIELSGTTAYGGLAFIYDGGAWRWREGTTTGFINLGGTSSVSISGIPYNSTGNYNVTIGKSAGGTGASQYNVALGWQSLLNNTSGGGNIGIGPASLLNVTTGVDNIGIGYYAGTSTASNVNANHNQTIFIGLNTGWSSGGTALTNTTIIGHQVRTDLSNVFMLGKSTQTIMIGQGTSVGSGAILQIDSTTKGFLPPRMTTTQKNAIGTPAQGLMVFDTTLVKLCVYSGTAWETITSL